MAISKHSEYSLARKRADDLLNSARSVMASCTDTTPALCSTEPLTSLTSANAPSERNHPSRPIAHRLNHYINDIEQEYNITASSYSSLFANALFPRQPFHTTSHRTQKSNPSPEQEHEIVKELTRIIFEKDDTMGDDILANTTCNEIFEKFGSSLPKKVCQHPFKKNDIVWVCRTCQADETCVLCHQCYDTSNHEGHDVAFYHAQAGGCCDCGDKDAWDPKGFCPLHGREDEVRLEEGMEGRVRGVVDSCIEHLGYMAANVETGYRRANSSVKRKFGRSNTFSGNIGPSDANMMQARILQRSNTIASDGQVFSGGPIDHAARNDESPMDISGSSHQSHDSPMRDANAVPSTSQNSNDGSIHDNVDADDDDECKFKPDAASRSKSRLLAKQETPLSNPINEEFNPEAASTSKSRNPEERKKQLRIETMTPAQHLGLIGSEQNGLYLLLHADDIHSTSEIMTALRSLFYSSPTRPERNLDLQCDKIARLLKQDIGDIIIWGTQELIDELGPVLTSCWKDGDNTACTRFGALMMEKAKIMTGYGMVVSIKTREELFQESQSAALLEFLNIMSKSCDPLCRLVTVGLGANESEDMSESFDEAKAAPAPSSIVNVGNPKDAHGNCVQLVSMLQSDLKLPRKIAKSWHELLLTLLAVSNFKGALANAYVDTYRIVTSEYAHGVGIFEKSSYTLSVQFLNRVTYVEDLVRTRDLLFCLVRSLYETLSVAIKTKIESIDDTVKNLRLKSAGDRSAMLLFDDYLSPLILGTGLPSWRGMFSKTNSDIDSSEDQNSTARFNPVLDPSHPVLAHRRYGPCVSDLKCVLNVQSIPRLLASLPKGKLIDGIFASEHFRPCLLDAWIDALALGQNMDVQTWRKVEEGHVEQEPRDWVAAFNTGISIGSLYERLLQWDDGDDMIESPLFREYRSENTFISAVEMVIYILTTGINSWQKSETFAYSSTSNGLNKESTCPACLPMSSSAVRFGSYMAMKALPVSQTKSWSFHLPLHRFVATSLREIARRPYSKDDGTACGIDELICRMKDQQDPLELERIYSGLMEFPLIVLSRNSQIRSDLWLRNGRGMSDQVLNYSEPPFCRILRDADLVLVQFAAIALFDLQRCHDFVGSSKIAPFSCSYLINLIMHRFGIFDFSGLTRAVEVDQEKYFKEVSDGLYPPEKQTDNSSSLPWTYSPSSDDPERSKSMLEEFLHTVIILITELISPPPLNVEEHSRQAKNRLRREIIHRLASGPKAHSELAEIHHVLPMRDNLILSEEGKLVNPDDASGAALEAALVEVAECKSYQGKSDQWELQRWAWNEYDPAFFHLSQRHHQDASENRPNALRSKTDKKVRAVPYVPFPPLAHRSFLRLRRDVTSDASLIAVLYRALHVHCRSIPSKDVFVERLKTLPCKEAYLSDAMSETILGRAVHLLTLGAYAWENSDDFEINSDWRIDGGGDTGSVFYYLTDVPTPQKWVEMILLATPENVMASDIYRGEENMLLLLRKLAYDGGASQFEVEDGSLRCGAAWLCEYAIRHSSEAASLIGNRGNIGSKESDSSEETDLQRRRREAKERIMKRMQQNMANFASSIDISDHNEHDQNNVFPEYSAPSTPSRSTSLHLEMSDDEKYTFKSIESRSETSDSPKSNKNVLDTSESFPVRCLLKHRPRCIICSEDAVIAEEADTSSLNVGRASKRKVLSFCGYIQASTVLKNGGGSPDPLKEQSSNLVGAHITLCGHAIHSSCCELHIRDSTEREERYYDRLENGKWSEFKCPMCRRLSNCLIPFVDVDVDWARLNVPETLPSEIKTLQDFLSTSKWWTSRNDKSCIWDGRCAFLPLDPVNKNTTTVSFFGKKTLYRSWVSAFRTALNCRISSNEEKNPVLNANSIVELWRKLIDQISDCTYKADIGRFGENRLHENVGEFRHYLTEKNVYNDFNSANYGIGATLWPMCISPVLSTDQKQELSREKLVSRHIQTIQSFTYSCCSELSECLRLFKRHPYPNKEHFYAKYGIQSIVCDGEFIIMPYHDSIQDGSQVFDGKVGRLRYVALPLLYTSGSLAREIVHLAMNMPITEMSREKNDGMKRSKIVYPILCGHVLTHTVAAVVAVCGDDLKSKSLEEKDLSDGCKLGLIEECLLLVQLGFLARILQVLLAYLTENAKDEPAIEIKVISAINQNQLNRSQGSWERGCYHLLHSVMSPAVSETNFLHEADDDITKMLADACATAKQLGKDFLCHVGFILQVLLPKSVTAFDILKEPQNLRNSTLEQLLHAFHVDDFYQMASYPLVSEIISNWYKDSRRSESQNELERRLTQTRSYEAYDWPNVCYDDLIPSTSDHAVSANRKGFPLFQGHSAKNARVNDEEGKCIEYLPTSYTDLYAALGKISPESELTAVCFVCGQVLDASGKGECTRHTYQCGGGCGIFFLLQDCICLALHKDKAAYLPSPYVDSHGETPQYRGRPLNIDSIRYDFLHELWSGHTLREHVIAERQKSTRNLLINSNFF